MKLKSLNVTLRFKDYCFGGIPRNEKLLENFVAAKGKNPQDAEDTEERVIDPTEEIEKSWTGFRMNKIGPYLRDFMVKQMLKEALSTLEVFVKKRGSKNLTNHTLQVDPREINFYRDRNGKGLTGAISEPDGFEDIQGTVNNQGRKMSILSRKDFVERPYIQFKVSFLDSPKLTTKHILEALEAGGRIGLGSLRNHEEGKFEIVEVTEG